MRRSKNPDAGIFHFDHRIDALGGAELEYFDHLRARNGIAIEGHDLKLVAGQGELDVLGGAGVENVKQHLLPLLHLDRVAVA